MTQCIQETLKYISYKWQSSGMGNLGVLNHMCVEYLFIYWQVFGGLSNSISKNHHPAMGAPLWFRPWTASTHLIVWSDHNWTCNIRNISIKPTNHAVARQLLTNYMTKLVRFDNFCCPFKWVACTVLQIGWNKLNLQWGKQRCLVVNHYCLLRRLKDLCYSYIAF